MTTASRTYAVIGTTEHALALAAELRVAGHRVIVSDREVQRSSIESLAGAPGLELDCEVESFAGGQQQTLVTGIEVTGDLAFAAAEADVIILMTPQTAYEEVLASFSGALRDDQIILLMPGGLGGSLLVNRLAAEAGAKGVLVAQTASMPISAQSARNDRRRTILDARPPRRRRLDAARMGGVESRDRAGLLHGGQYADAARRAHIRSMGRLSCFRRTAGRFRTPPKGEPESVGAMNDLYIVYVAGQDMNMVDDPDVVVLDEGLYLVRSGQTRSQLYHSVKRRTAPARLLVAPLADLPKFKGMKEGSFEKARRLLR